MAQITTLLNGDKIPLSDVLTVGWPRERPTFPLHRLVRLGGFLMHFAQ